jgi:urease accessory protein
MKSSASIVVVAENGFSKITEMISQPPLTFRETTDGVMIVNTAAGPIGGDRLELHIEVQDGADLILGGVAASMALPGAPGTGHSKLDISIKLGENSKLVWKPQPLILASGSHHQQLITISAHSSSQFIYGDTFQFGRHEEETGRIEQHLSVRINNVEFLRQSTDINPHEDWKEALSLQNARNFTSYITYGIEIENSDDFTEFNLENGIKAFQVIGKQSEPRVAVKAKSH